MNRRVFTSLAFIAMTVTWTLYTSCEQPQDTSKLVVAGNPLVGTPPANQMSSQIRDSICDALVRCYPSVSVDDCQAGVNQSSGIGSRIGLRSGQYDLFTNMIYGESQGLVLANLVASNPCYSNLGALSCSSPEIIMAYNSQSSNPFSNVANIIPTQGSCLDTAAVRGDWQWAPITQSNGLNFQASQHAYNPWTLVFNSKLYMTWTENNSWDSSGSGWNIRVAYYDGNDLSPSFHFIDGSTLGGLNYDASQKNISTPILVSLNSKLYAFWDEASGSSSLIRAKVYNGNDASPSWNSIDLGGLNFNKTKSAGVPQAQVFNGKLYVSWSEDNGSATQIRVAVYNGNDTAPSWSNLQTTINFNVNKSATAPSFMIFNSKLYLSWMEIGTSGNNAIRMAAYNGNDSNPAWTSISGSGGVDFNSAYEARNPRAISFNNKLYLSWEEWNSGTSEQIRIAVYNGNDSLPQWAFVDGGSTPILNYNASDKSQGPQLVVFNSQLISVWREETSGIGHVRAKIYGGDDANPSWALIDGGGPLGLNFNPSSDILYAWNHGPTLSLFNSKVYSIWAENYHIYVKVGVLP